VVSTACGDIEYAVRGQGPPLLLVHGAGGGFDQGLHFAGDLGAMQVIAMSRFGYLRTPLPADASPAAQADAHACLLDSLRVRSAVILGASAGAPSAMQFCIRHRNRCTGLVLLVPLAYPRPADSPPPSAFARFMFERAIRSDFLFWLAMRAAPSLVVRTVLATPPEQVERASVGERGRVQRMMESILPLGERQNGLRNDAAIAVSLPRFELEKITAPTLAISTRDDLYGTLEGARHSAEHIDGARLMTFDDGGHLWVGHHDEVIAGIQRFLQTTASHERPKR
jgi:pimeloyl-ACP methyl ester carboxylesterase